jgi:MarR family 2-MHQ and catechol resistance regulon transcriptional repressor
MMRHVAVGPAPFERELRHFLKPRGVDLDAQAVLFQLYRTSTDAVAATEAAALRGLGLSHAGYVLLMTLWISGPREVRDLARAQRVSKPAIVSCVHTLERSDLVRRVRSVTDRRLVRVELTKRGRARIEKAQLALHRCERALTRDLSVRDKRRLAELLRRLGRAARNVALGTAA